MDGVTATALLYQHLKGMGANVKCMLPSREGDGYGLSKNAIQSIHDKGYQLIVTVGQRHLRAGGGRVCGFTGGWT